MGFFEIIPDSLGQDRRRKRTERLAVLDPAIQYILHLGPARIDDDAAVSQRPRPKFHPSLKPTHDFSVRNSFRSLFYQLLLRQFRNSTVRVSLTG